MKTNNTLILKLLCGNDLNRTEECISLQLTSRITQISSNVFASECYSIGICSKNYIVCVSWIPDNYRLCLVVLQQL